MIVCLSTVDENHTAERWIMIWNYSASLPSILIFSAPWNSYYSRQHIFGAAQDHTTHCFKQTQRSCSYRKITKNNLGLQLAAHLLNFLNINFIIQSTNKSISAYDLYQLTYRLHLIGETVFDLEKGVRGWED